MVRTSSFVVLNNHKRTVAEHQMRQGAPSSADPRGEGPRQRAFKSCVGSVGTTPRPPPRPRPRPAPAARGPRGPRARRTLRARARARAPRGGGPAPVRPAPARTQLARPCPWGPPPGGFFLLLFFSFIFFHFFASYPRQSQNPGKVHDPGRRLWPGAFSIRTAPGGGFEGRQNPGEVRREAPPGPVVRGRCLPVHHGSGIGIGIEYRDLSGIGRIGRPLPLVGAPGGEGRPIREARVASAVRR